MKWASQFYFYIRLWIKVEMIKPVVIVADDASKAELESDLHVWDESTFRANASALGGDINAILVTSQSQKIDDLLPSITNLVAIVSTCGEIQAAGTKAKMITVGSVKEAITTIQKAVDGELWTIKLIRSKTTLE